MVLCRIPTYQNNVSIASLAADISALSMRVSSYLDANYHGQPDFTPTSVALPETPEFEALRNQVNDSALDLLRLVNGPKNTFRTLFFSHMDLAAAQVALSQKFFEHVPDDKVGISAAEVAMRAGMDEDRTTRLLKMLATHRIFEEQINGKFRHTASSSFLRTSAFNAMCEASLDDFFKATSEMNAWIEQSPYSMGLEDSAFHKRFGATFYGHYEENPAKATRFSNAMNEWSLIDDNFAILRDRFDWLSLTNAKVVDVGGGNGHVSIDLANEFPFLTFTVQDLSTHQLSTAQAHDVQNRVTFQQYNFFTPQPIHDAGVYLCRAIFHNHNDEDSIKMLRSLIPALEDRSDDPRILINDIIVPERAEGAVTRAEENQHRQMDLLMLALFGAKERTKRDWKRLLEEVDPRLEILSMHYNPRGAGLIEVRLNPTTDKKHPKLSA
ncbi:S-adenosyl-L-methionine-dependent methyltransferase [Cucurbitaria berberidis CBS 394.84]|uniref:S-adenosyl-L-methionine-dependent methyltransferase n=1 Tax=Cucurbitaria berberidis CBS 394.84 TaxID=1168544 RepID=A0A9P4GPL5_9PLEO|nr:S-adenosyl-L-methionine-dependent methyltransferase [Cucurbitaria berberidis CBS 394.84]KAF1848831.1 S-adenosyl-L-methionine-dependent methyltransferase [Cucurbitaria berberidis CBS 394.84]